MAEIKVDYLGPNGIKQTVKGVLRRSSVCRGRVAGFWSSLWSSSVVGVAGFGTGVLVSVLIGSALLFLQKIPIWLCAQVTVGLGCACAFGMGLSRNVRTDVAVMLPSLFSGHGRSLLSLVLVTSLLSGPVTNSLHNTEMAASSLICSAQLSANQTQELLRRAASPLASVLDSVREISANAYEAAGRINNLIQALTNTVRHVARTLRKLLHFLVDIGDLCNDEMGAPYKKCRALFEAARTDCMELLGDFNFLCDILQAFLPLCELARAGEVFCIIPSYVAEQLKKRLAAPVVAAFERLKQEFAFDLDATVIFDLEANSSQSLQEVTQQILEEVTSELTLLERLREPLNYSFILVLIWAYYRAARYRRSYLKNLEFDNVYVGAAFKDLDDHVTSGGGASVLPITARESRVYTSPLSLRLSNQERRTVLVGLTSVLRLTLIGGVLVALDFLVFWILDQVQHQASADIVARAPVQVQVQVNGSGFAADLYRDLVQSFQILQSHNLTVFSRVCVVQPRPPDYNNLITLGFLSGLLLLVSACGGFVQRSRRVICSWFYPQREQERLWFLRRRILEQRRSERRALRTVFYRTSLSPPHRPGRVYKILLRCPLVSRLLSQRKTCCVSCSTELSPDTTVSCQSPSCTGVFCGVCVRRWRNTCLVCGRPLTSEDDLSDLELGSSDEEDSGLNSELNQDRAGQNQYQAELTQDRVRLNQDQAGLTQVLTTEPLKDHTEGEAVEDEAYCSDASDDDEEDFLDADSASFSSMDKD